MCRAHFDKLFIPEVNLEFQKHIADQMGAQFEERKQELEAEGEWNKATSLLKISFGNTHEDVRNPRKDGGHTMSHRWCMFLSVNESPVTTRKYIKSVTYHLHPTYRVNKIKVNEAPFLLSRVAWGYFEVCAEIEFQPQRDPKTGKQKSQTACLYHMLSFDGNGKTKGLFVEV